MVKYLVQHRRGTAEQWAEQDTLIPREGEIVIEIDEVNSLHKLKIGDGVHTYAELAYLQAGDEIVTQVLTKAMPRVVTIELASTWTKDADEKYSQVLTLDGITENSRLDLQPTADMLAEFKKLGLVFVTENNGGTITVYSVGNMPLKAYTMQATIIEAECLTDGCVVGSPTGTPLVQPDWNQNDPTMANYVLNRTHYEELVEILPETTIEDGGGGQFLVAESAIPVVGDEEYIVNFNGTEYTVKCVDMSAAVGGAPAKAFLLGSSGFPVPDGEPPFGLIVMENVPDMGTMTAVMVGSEYEGQSITIGVKEKKAVKIPTKFIPTLEEMRVEETVIIPETELSGTETNGRVIFMLETDFSYTVGSTYRIMWNGVEYTCVAVDVGNGFGAIGNLSVNGMSGGNVDAPFISVNDSGTELGFAGLDGSTTLKVSVAELKTVKIPTKFIPTLEEMRSEFVEIVPLTGFTPSYDSSIDAPMAMLNDFELVAGNKYKVTYDGAEYICEAFSGTLGTMAFTAIGNKILIGGEDTGDPFGVGKIVGASVGFVISMDMNSHSVQVLHEDAVKIPVKYIPTLEEMCGGTATNILEPTTVDLTTEDFRTPKTPLVVGETYTVHWGTDKYECVATKIPAEVENMFPTGSCALGNIAAFLGAGDSGEPFAALCAPGLGLAFVSMDESITEIQVSVDEKVSQIPKKLIPPIDELLVKEIEILPLTEATYNSSKGDFTLNANIVFVPNETYVVNWNGVSYTCVAIGVDETTIIIGNFSKIDHSLNDTGEPFIIGLVNGNLIIMPFDGATTLTLSITHIKAVKIPEACLPDIGASVPDVTAEDNGAFLRVVDGSWAAVQLPRVEESEF